MAFLTQHPPLPRVDHKWIARLVYPRPQVSYVAPGAAHPPPQIDALTPNEAWNKLTEALKSLMEDKTYYLGPKESKVYNVFLGTVFMTNHPRIYVRYTQRIRHPTYGITNTAGTNFTVEVDYFLQNNMPYAYAENIISGLDVFLNPYVRIARRRHSNAATLLELRQRMENDPALNVVSYLPKHKQRRKSKRLRQRSASRRRTRTVKKKTKTNINK